MDGKNDSDTRERREFNVDMNVWLLYNKLHVNRTYIYSICTPTCFGAIYTIIRGRGNFHRKNSNATWFFINFVRMHDVYAYTLFFVVTFVKNDSSISIRSCLFFHSLWLWYGLMKARMRG